MWWIEIEKLYSDVDDFNKETILNPTQKLLPPSNYSRFDKFTMSVSEVMTIVILFHMSGYRNFKTFYTEHVCKHMKSEFPRLVSYNRFIELQASLVIPLVGFLHSQLGECTGVSFVDSTKIIVCHQKRAHSHKVFDEYAKWGKTSTGWFYGFKLHLVTNEYGELLAVKLTFANTDDRKPVPELTEGLIGKLFGDKGYISQKLFEALFERGLQLITRIKKNMKNKLMPVLDKILLRKRAVIESVIDFLKNMCQIEHTRHRSTQGFLVSLLAGLIAYSYIPKKPSLNIRPKEHNLPELAAF